MPLDVNEVEDTFDAFRRKLKRAIRATSSEDLNSIHKLSAGVAALSKAMATIHRLKFEQRERARQRVNDFYDD